MLTEKEWSLFIVIQIAMVVYAYCEAVLEGEEGWAKDRSVWRFKIYKDFDYTSYHIAIYFIALPLLIIALPLLASGFSWRLFWILYDSYLLGTMFEDFMWFVFNPRRSLSRWNPRETTWYPWLQIKKFYLPWSYVYKPIMAAIIYYYLIRGH